MPTTTDFKFDVFLSHSSKDKEVVRPIAERLRADGLRVWLDDWEIKPRTTRVRRAKKIEEGLEQSRVLVFCMSVNAFGSDWAQLEAGTFRFRDPLNMERRFIPLRLDKVTVKDSLAQLIYISWLPEARDLEYVKLLEACWPSSVQEQAEAEESREYVAEKVIKLNYKVRVSAYLFSPDGKRALIRAKGVPVYLWDIEAKKRLRVLAKNSGNISSIAWSVDQSKVLTGEDNGSVRLWDLQAERCLRVFDHHSRTVIFSLAWSPDQRQALSGSGSDAHVVKLWDTETGYCSQAFEAQKGVIYCVAFSANRVRVLSGGSEKTLRLWDVKTGKCLRVFEGHTGDVNCISWSADNRRAISGSDDSTVRLWNVETGHCLRVLRGHAGWVRSVAWSSDSRHVLSGSKDGTMRLWDVVTGRCLRVLEGHSGEVVGVAWSDDQCRAFSGDEVGCIRRWNLSEVTNEARGTDIPSLPLLSESDQVRYTNAKVLLVGESGAGKTGLSKRLALNDWQPSDSTVGTWATQWKLTVPTGSSVEREIWLWDFGGQADQRLIHQLYMDETALAVLVFDGQKEDLFETLGQWDRDLARASRQSFSKLLVAGRVDAGGLRVSRTQIEAFRSERGYLQLLETSAKANLGCEELRQAILNGIRWEDIPWRSSPLLFKRLKEEIVRIKEESRVLIRFNELRESLTLRLSDEGVRFTDEEVKAVVSLLSGPGVVWELTFGSWVLLQPEIINAYAQAVIQTMREDEHERGCLLEERVLSGDLAYHSSMERLAADEERFILLAMHQILIERGLCLREHTAKGSLLVFPSYYRRERPELVGHPAVLLSYRFNGFLDDVYATLVVRLHHTDPFRQDKLWRYAADFKTLTGKQLGVKLTRRAEGAGELEVYFDPKIPLEEKIIFSKYVHEHLLQNSIDVERLRYHVCLYCGTSVGNREVAMRRLEEGKRDILCVNCERRIPLWDALEELFASPEMKQRVHELQKQSAFVLDTESKERALVGDVISTVALACQITREFSVSDHGIDMEIEFKSDAGEATGQKLYLQLKSGDSYLRKQTRAGQEIFTIKKERHARYWMDQAFPVLLVIRNSDGEVRWMEVRDWLTRASGGGKKPVKQIVFEGERFDVMSVRRWRDNVLSARPAR
jgi:small GTP-binding protein